MDMTIEKHCSGCDTTQPSNNFHKQKRSPDGLQTWCKACRERHRQNTLEQTAERQRVWYLNNREKIVEKGWKQQGIKNFTVKDKEVLLAGQDNQCAICSETFENGCCVDHNHATGEARLLLCTRCNFGLGHFRDNPELLRNAADYLDLEV